MHIDLSELMSVKGNQDHREVPVTLEAFCFQGQDYPFGKKEALSLTISCTGTRKVLVEGEVKLTVLIPCARCLKEVELPFDVKIEKELDFNETAQKRIEDLDEANYVDGHVLDTDRLIYNELVLMFPISVLCSEDCRGICSVCGADLNEGPCSCDREAPDPRMAAIRDIFNQFKEV